MRTVLITGANSGIGKSTATALAAKGYRVVFIARNPEKAAAVKLEIIKITKNEAVDFILADLLSLNQVKKAVEIFKEKYQQLDILINNAGVCLPQRKLTEDGLEEMFQINHLSHFLLTHLLLDLLIKSEDARIINLSSGGYRVGRFDPANLQSEKFFHSVSTYCNTKLMNILFTKELSQRLKNTAVKVNAVHPGVVRTNFAGGFNGIFKSVYQKVKPILLSPEKGASTTIFLATADEVRHITGKYFFKSKVTKTWNIYINDANQKKLWEKSMELAGLNTGNRLSNNP